MEPDLSANPMIVSQSTNINTLGVFFLLSMVLLIFFLRRKYIIIPIIIASCYITAAQQFVIAGFNFSVLRIIVLAGWLRILLCKEYVYLKMQKIDKIIIIWVILRTVIFVIQNRTFDSLVYRLGNAYDILGLYFMFRSIIRDFEDIHRIISITAVCILPLVLFMLYEKLSGINLFSIFGGVPFYTYIRDGRLRAQGSFSHSILAGTFGAVSFVIISSLGFSGKKKRSLFILGLTASVFIIIASASSGPLLSFFVGLLGLFLWRYRKNLKSIKQGVVVGLITLEIAMKPPIWALFGKISGIFGGTGWHRTMLIDAFVAHFKEWWFIGTNYTAHWMPTVLPINPNMTDITNWYIGEAVGGGLITMVFFLYMFVTCYKIIGRARRLLHDRPVHARFTVWTLGVALMVHNLSILSVVYFDQTITFFFMLVAMIAFLSTLEIEHVRPAYVHKTNYLSQEI